MDISSEDETFYTTRYQMTFLKYLENEHGAKHRCASVRNPEGIPITNLVPTTTGAGSSQSSLDS